MTDPQTTDLSWSFPVVVSGLPEGGAEFDVTPDEAAREELAKFADVLAVPLLRGRFQVRRSGKGAVVDGTIEGAVRQACVVTLEPFDNPFSESVSLRFSPHAPGAQEAGIEIDAAADDPPDPLVNDRIDLAAVIAEFLALAIDPYPRKPGAEFSAPENTADKDPSPFAVLEKLKGRSDNGKA